MRKFIQLGIVLMVSCTPVSKTTAQPPIYSSTNAKAIKLYEEGLKLYEARENAKAEKEFIKAIEKDPAFVEPLILLANIYVEAGNFEKAIEQYQKSFAINPNFFPGNYFQAATIEMKVGKYEEAKKHYEKYLSYGRGAAEAIEKAKRYLLSCDFAIKSMKAPVAFKPVNMGAGVNSVDYEYFPSITADDQTILFTRNQRDAQGRMGQEDFYTCTRKGQEWTTAVGLNINTPDNEGAPSLSADGQTLVFAACEKPTGMGSCDLYYSRKSGAVWSRPRNIGMPVNTAHWETQPSFSSDGRTLYFIRGILKAHSIQNPDIYVSTFDDKNGWSQPARLSDKINTTGDESSVFIHPDNQTLYFSSNGHVGMGGLDIYMSRKQPDGSWGDPINLGYPINTCNDENSLLVGPDGNIAYFASDREGGYGGLDLYSFELDKSLKPLVITFMKGKVYDAKTKKPLEAAFQLIDLASGKNVVESFSNPGNGEFLLTLPVNKNYALNVSREGYAFYSESFELANITEAGKPYLMDVPLLPLDTGIIIELKNVFFETAKFDLKEESKAELQKVVSFLTTNPGIKVELGGHTDNVGNQKLNQVLSNNRAKSVYDYLIGAGITKDRLSYKGYGDFKPKVPNDTPENRAKNRRTELKIISKS